MIVTTSRKPSRKTRVFCRRLCAFFNLDYFTRGKTSMAAMDDAIVVGDRKGNPGSIRVYRGSDCKLSLLFTMRSDDDINIRRREDLKPVVIGTNDLSSMISDLLDLQHNPSFEPENMTVSGRKMIVTNDSIECIETGKTVFVFKIIGYRIDAGG